VAAKDVAASSPKRQRLSDQFIPKVTLTAGARAHALSLTHTQREAERDGDGEEEGQAKKSNGFFRNGFRVEKFFLFTHKCNEAIRRKRTGKRT
jgi:hypothetical protein